MTATLANIRDGDRQVVGKVRTVHEPATAEDRAAVNFRENVEIRRFNVASIPSLRDVRPGMDIEYPADADERHTFRIAETEDDGANIAFIANRTGYPAP